MCDKTAGRARRRALGAALGALLSYGCGLAPGPDGPPLRTVARVDLDRYLGLWHEQAKIPNRFQDQCVRDTRAEYAALPDGRIRVLNSCVNAEGLREQAEGVARVTDPGTGAKLEVSFFSILGWRPVWGDYWVIGLDPDYRWAVVGTPGRGYGWVLSRAPELDPGEWAAVDALLRERGYDPGLFEHDPG